MTDRTLPQDEKAKWCLKGYDTFEGEWYDIDGEYDTEAEAKKAARERLKELERTQPTATSGGQYGGIQDRVFVVHSNGTVERIT